MDSVLLDEKDEEDKDLDLIMTMCRMNMKYECNAVYHCCTGSKVYEWTFPFSSATFSVLFLLCVLLCCFEAEHGW